MLGNNHPVENTNRGRYIKSKTSENPRTIAFDATVRKAVRETGTTMISDSHLMEKVRMARSQCLNIIILDNSSSMRMDKKIRMAKTITWQLLKQSYENRNEVCLIAFENNTPVTLVEPTKDMAVVDEKLEMMKSGGKTPLTPALFQAVEIISKNKNSNNQLIIISDGKGNVFKNQNIHEDLEEVIADLSNTDLLLINASEKFKSTGQMEKLSEYLASEHIYLDDLI